MPQPEGHLPQVVKKREGPMPELRKRRSYLALLGVFAMVASTLAVGASSATAAAGNAEAAADFSACVGPAMAAKGYTDVAAGSTHEAAINCIAYYGITKGTTATTFAPGQTISRWQLAVMLQRAAGPANVDLPEAQDQGFTDISEMSSSFQEAINQMAALGVMTGTSATTFDPSGIVSRATIVEALAGFLTKTAPGPGGNVLSRDVNGRYTVKDGTGANANTIDVDESFRDIGGVPFASYEAIRALAEMGVVSGRGDGTFGPAVSVTRAQAASFITRALAHTNVRPAGLTVQAARAAVVTNADVELSISLRGNDFAPLDSASVDIFRHTVANAARAFNADGTCTNNTVVLTTQVAGASACLIELGDEVTEPTGNLTVQVDAITEPSTFWVWSGDVGDKLDWDDSGLSRDNSVASNAASVTVGTITVPSTAMVSLSIPKDAQDGNTARYGTSVTVTIQLLDSKKMPIGVSGMTYQWSATGMHDPTGPDRVIPGIGTRVVTTDSNGRASFTLTQADPDTNKNQVRGSDNALADDMTTWSYTISPGVSTSGGPSTGLVSNNGDGGIGFVVAPNGTGTGDVVFNDDLSDEKKVTIELQRSWTQIPAGATAGTRLGVGVTGKVVDQYGHAMRGAPVYFDVDGDAVFGCQTPGSTPPACTTVGTGDNSIDNNQVGGTTRRLTRSNGTNRVTATHITGSSTIFRATYIVGADINSDMTIEASEQAEAVHYWASGPLVYNTETGVGAQQPFGRILLLDPTRDAIIREGPGGTDPTDGVNVYTYNDDTRFRWYEFADGALTPSPLGDKWMTSAELEGRWGRYIEWCNTPAGETAGCPTWGNTGAQVAINSYNTKAGPIVLTVGIAEQTNSLFNAPG